MRSDTLLAVCIHTCLLVAAGVRHAHGESVTPATTVPLVRLSDGRDMPALALGTWLGNDTMGRIEPKGSEVEDAVKWALAAGYRHLDTAAVYKVEEQVGRGVASAQAAGVARDQLFITTKLWNDRHARAAVVPALRESLQKLGLEYVDLYLIHWPTGYYANHSVDPTDYLDTWRGMMDARSEGLTRSIGLSNFNQEQMDRILQQGLESPAVLQVEINLNLQQPALLAYCRQKNITVMGYTPFGSLFRGRAKAGAPPPRSDAPELLALADKYNKTVPQLVLRYLVDLGVVPIPKSLTKSRIEQNLAVFDFQLSQADRDQLQKYDANYRTIPQMKAYHHPYYPFEKED